MSAQNTYDVIVVGAGLSGLFAGAVAAKRGARTLVIARGLGGLQVGAGTIGVSGPHPPAPSPVRENREQERGRTPTPALPRPQKAWTGEGEKHPLALAGEVALRAGLSELQAMCAAAEYPLVGRLEENFSLPTALGAVRSACLVPESFANGEVQQPGEMGLARWPGFRDFFADLAVANLNAAGYAARAVSLTLPEAPTQRDAFATDLARLFDKAEYREKLAREWRPALKGVERLGLPAVLGLRHAHAAWLDLQEKLDVMLFEIPILPPSVPGMRLFNVLKQTVEAHGGRVTIGPGITGWVAADPAGGALGVVAETAGGARHYTGRDIILATGGFRHGGLESPRPGAARESVFDLPVATAEQWFAPLYWGAHPYAQFGVRVNEHMQVVRGEEVIFDNVLAIGGLLAGADRNGEGSREGIDVATAWKAVETVLNAN